MSEPVITRFTDTLSGSVDKLYKTGGFALAFGFAGIIMVLGAKIFGQSQAMWLIVIGAVLTFSCLGFFLITTLKGNAKASRAISDNKEAIDAVQDISIQLTKLVSAAQAYSFKNIDKINSALTLAIPALQKIPFVKEKVSEYGLEDVSLVSSTIVDNSDRIEKAVNEIEDALINADHERLREYSDELAFIVASLKEQLKK